MTGIAQTGAQEILNSFTKAVVPVIGGSAPTWEPGLYWVDSGVLKEWNGSAWAAITTDLYLALCTADPSGLTTIGALTEVTTSGYSRVATTWGYSSATVPSTISNSDTIIFGPMSADMLLAAQWVALVTVASGTTGLLKYTWVLDEPEQVETSQSIAIAVGTLTISQS